MGQPMPRRQGELSQRRYRAAKISLQTQKKERDPGIQARGSTWSYCKRVANRKKIKGRIQYNFKKLGGGRGRERLNQNDEKEKQKIKVSFKKQRQTTHKRGLEREVGLGKKKDGTGKRFEKNRASKETSPSRRGTKTVVAASKGGKRKRAKNKNQGKLKIVVRGRARRAHASMLLQCQGEKN